MTFGGIGSQLARLTCPQLVVLLYLSLSNIDTIAVINVIDHIVHSTALIVSMGTSISSPLH
jgi:hypothetical protein